MKNIIMQSTGAGGTTSLLTREAGKKFNPNPASTIGQDFIMLKGKIQPDTSSSGNVRLWDYAGQVRYRHITNPQLKQADALIACLDLTDEREFESIKSLLQDFKQHRNPSAPILIFANKVDLVDKRKITDEQLDTLVSETAAERYFICSAKTGDGVQEAFQHVYSALASKHTATATSASEPAAQTQPPLPPVGALTINSSINSSDDAPPQYSEELPVGHTWTEGGPAVK